MIENEADSELFADYSQYLLADLYYEPRDEHMFNIAKSKANYG